jgi:glycosyltransferase involved in cell wall biosynthesis
MRVFVYQAFVQAGGTHMAYHIGAILEQRFGLEVVAVGAAPESGLFRYPVDLPVIDEDTMLATASAADLLICNPSFSDRMFGLRLPCRKLSYVQGVRTFRVLDVFYDRYVFVSKFARRFVNQHYGIDGPVIPAFIDTDTFCPGTAAPVKHRQPVCAILERKHEPLVFERLCRTYERLHGGERLPVEMLPVLPQQELAVRLRESRVFLGLDVMEGFGLPMLEAMACGCAVAGWDSGGCGEYARNGRNALVARYGDFEALARLLRTVLVEDVVAERLASSGMKTGAEFSRGRFSAAWERELASFLGRSEPSGDGRGRDWHQA